ncbi:MAG: hypothetical protein ACP5O3_01965 [Candidatus Micrarchaeia archaeon]
MRSAPALLSLATATALFFLQCASTQASSLDVTAGYAYENNLTATINTARWLGIYGNLSNTTGASNFTGSPPTISELTVFYSTTCKKNANYLFASTASTINWTALGRGLPSDVDAFISATPTESDSGTRTFADSADYLIGSTTINGVNVTYTKSYNNSQSFDVGLLKDASTGALVFITRIQPNATSFNNKTVDYQLMLPANPYSANNTYYFYSFLGPDCAECSIQLVYGWNLISLCNQLTNNSIANVLAPLAGEYLYVMRWNNSTNEFELYSPQSPSNPFDKFEEQYSYFIYSLNTSTTEFDITGTKNPDMNISLLQYWNTPAWPYEFNASITNETQSIAGDWQYVMKWNTSTKEFDIYSAEAVQNPFTQIFAGEGQFLYYKLASGTLSFNRSALGG